MSVGALGHRDRCAEVGKHGQRVLRGICHRAHEHGVARPGEAIQGGEIRHQAGAERIQVDVADHLQEVRLLFDERGLETVLEEVAGAPVLPIEGDGVAGEQAAHARGPGSSRACV